MPGVSVFNASTTDAVTPKTVISAQGVGQYLTVYKIVVSNPIDSAVVGVSIGSVDIGTKVFFALRPGETKERTFPNGVNFGHDGSLRFGCDVATTGVMVTVLAETTGSPVPNELTLGTGTDDGDVQVIVPLATNLRLVIDSIGVANANVSTGSNATLALNYATAHIIIGTQPTGTTGGTGFIDFPMATYQTIEQRYSPPINVGIGQGIFIKADDFAPGIVVNIESRSLALDLP